MPLNKQTKLMINSRIGSKWTTRISQKLTPLLSTQKYKNQKDRPIERKRE